MSENIQLPTVGRIVHFHTTDHPAAALPAIVVEVTDGSHTIDTLHVFEPDGIRIKMNVKHASHSHIVEGADYWDWMTHQKNQAAKAEELEKQLKQQVEIGRTGPSGGQMARLATKVDNLREQGDRGRITDSVDRELSKTQAGAPSREDGRR